MLGAMQYLTYYCLVLSHSHGGLKASMLPTLQWTTQIPRDQHPHIYDHNACHNHAMAKWHESFM